MEKFNPEHYAYRVDWSEEDQEFVGTCVEFPSLSWLEESQVDALSGIRELVKETIDDLALAGELIPEPINKKSYSGKLSLRMTPQQHRRLAMEAAEERVSINRLVNSRLALR